MNNIIMPEIEYYEIILTRCQVARLIQYLIAPPDDAGQSTMELVEILTSLIVTKKEQG